MSLIERIANRDDDEIIYVEWKEVKQITLDEIAYVSIYDWIRLSKKCDLYIKIRVWESGIDVLIDEHDGLFKYATHLDYILLLILLKEKDIINYYTPVEIFYDTHEQEKYTVSEVFLEYAWKFAVENGLEFTKFGKIIIALGYTPPKTELYHNFMSRLQPKQVKSARKIDN